ncbi:MAG TPA: hypothetical protein VKE42_01820 [Candidatus Cybelea sp.]|nr:hypothetical protein [Candidatus Cybelea sp.]
MSDVSSRDASDAWWRQLDDRIIEIVETRWKHFYTAEIAKALGEERNYYEHEIEQVRRGMLTLDRQLVAVEHQLEAVHAQLAIKDAVDNITRSVAEARDAMPTLQFELRSELRSLRRGLDETRSMVEPGETRLAAEVAALNRKFSGLRASVSQVRFALDERERTFIKRQAQQIAQEEADQRRAEREQRERAGAGSGSVVRLTEEAALFLAGQSTPSESASESLIVVAAGSEDGAV